MFFLAPTKYACRVSHSRHFDFSMKFDNQLRYGAQIIASYKGDIPLSSWLKAFFRDHPQMGSNDRKQLSSMVYHYYRLGHTLLETEVEERILAGLFLCSQAPLDVLAHFRPQWNQNITLSLDEKIIICQEAMPKFKLAEIFPWPQVLSHGVDHLSFCKSFLEQPRLFLRLRPGQESKVRDKLTKASVEFTDISPSCLSLKNASRIEGVIDLNREAVIQDLSSQQVGSFFGLPNAKGTATSVWDCCAASGGKSILAYDLDPSIRLTVTDIRPSILANLRKRFDAAAIRGYQSFAIDLSRTGLGQSRGPGFDLIIADLPCTGSGTWSRNPEGLFFFQPEAIEKYSSLQRSILAHVVPSLKKGSSMVYITCSVFNLENEGVTEFLQEEFQLLAENKACLTGYDRNADSMFVSRFSFSGQ